MDLGIAGKTVIVTGGASNIGKAITLTFAQEKCNVVIADYDEVQGQKTAAEASALGGKVIAVKTDVSKQDMVQAMVKKTLEEFKQVDILVNNAGWMLGSEFAKYPKDLMEKIVGINLWGHIYTMQAVLPNMIERKTGSIICVASDAGRVGESGSSIYGACKGGVIALVKTVAKEYGQYGIRVNTVCPGLTLPGDPPGNYKPGDNAVGESSMWKTPYFTPEKLKMLVNAVYPLKKIGSPQDLANAIVFMSSPRAGHITGQTLSVSGGYTML